MRLAIVSTMAAASWGGSEELWAAAAMEAVRRGFHVGAFLFEWPSVPARVSALLAAGVEVFTRPQTLPTFGRRVRAKLRRQPLYLTPQLQRFRPDLVVFNLGTAQEVVYFPEVTRFLETGNVPCTLICQHNHDGPVREPLRETMANAYSRAVLSVFISQRNKDAAERQIARPISTAVVLQNPVNLPSFDRLPWPAGDCARLASVARLACGAKAQDLLFEALSGQAWRERNWRLSLYGEGPDRRYLQALATHYRIGDRICFAGHVPAIGEVWRENHLLVLTSRSEGTSLALLEAAVAGRPAVVTDVGDSARWVTEGATGFIAEGVSTPSISQALDRAWHARANWQAMGERAHEQIMRVLDRSPGITLLEAVLKGSKLR